VDSRPTARRVIRLTRFSKLVALGSSLAGPAEPIVLARLFGYGPPLAVLCQSTPFPVKGGHAMKWRVIAAAGALGPAAAGARRGGRRSVCTRQHRDQRTRPQRRHADRG